MKKLLPLLTVLLALAAVIVFTWRRVGGIGEKFPIARAAELAPADAVAFFLAPDLDRAVAHWEKSDLHAVAGEQEWTWEGAQRFLAQWQQKAEGDADAGPILRVLAAMRKMRPAGIFLAAASFEPPRIVGGFPCAAKRTEVDAAVRAVKEELFKAWPGAKSELSKHRGIEIETITSAPRAKGPPLPPAGGGAGGIPVIKPYFASQLAVLHPPLATVHLAFRDDWVFFATDLAALAGTLDRYLGIAGAARSLAQNPVFAECRKHEAPEAELLVWGSPVGAENFMQHWPVLAFLWHNRANPWQAVHYSGRLDGPARLYFHLTHAPPATSPVEGAVTLTTPDTRAYATVNIDAFRDQDEWLKTELLLSEDWRLLVAALADQKVSADDLWTAFGPRLTAISPVEKIYKWPGITAPADFVLALEVRDLAKARALARKIGAAENAPPILIEAEIPLPISIDGRQGEPAPIVLTKTHLFVGRSRTAVREVMAHAVEGGPSLRDNRDHTAALEKTVSPNAVFFYANTRRLLHEGDLPLPEVARRVFPSTFPGTMNEAVARHLRPGAICVRSEGPGWLVESGQGVLGDLLAARLLSDGKWENALFY